MLNLEAGAVLTTDYDHLSIHLFRLTAYTLGSMKFILII